MVRKRTNIFLQTAYRIGNKRRTRRGADTVRGMKAGGLREAARFHHLSRRRSGVADRAGAFIMAWYASAKFLSMTL